MSSSGLVACPPLVAPILRAPAAPSPRFAHSLCSCSTMSPSTVFLEDERERGCEVRRISPRSMLVESRARSSPPRPADSVSDSDPEVRLSSDWYSRTVVSLAFPGSGRSAACVS